MSDNRNCIYHDLGKLGTLYLVHPYRATIKSILLPVACLKYFFNDIFQPTVLWTCDTSDKNVTKIYELNLIWKENFEIIYKLICYLKSSTKISDPFISVALLDPFIGRNSAQTSLIHITRMQWQYPCHISTYWVSVVGMMMSPLLHHIISDPILLAWRWFYWVTIILIQYI